MTGIVEKSQAGSSPIATEDLAAWAAEATATTTTARIPGDPIGGARMTAGWEETGGPRGEGMVLQENPRAALPSDQADRAIRPWIQDSALSGKD